MIGLHPQKDVYRLSAELGYWIGEPFWGNGIATKAVELILKYGFETLNLNRIYAGVFEHNIASMRVLEKCDFVKEGIAKQAVIKNNKVIDEHKFAIIKV
jgi:RimJ/RimL family protein N-acetyltransferase